MQHVAIKSSGMQVRTNRYACKNTENTKSSVSCVGRSLIYLGRILCQFKLRKILLSIVSYWIDLCHLKLRKIFPRVVCCDHNVKFSHDLPVGLLMYNRPTYYLWDFSLFYVIICTTLYNYAARIDRAKFYRIVDWMQQTGYYPSIS